MAAVKKFAPIVNVVEQIGLDFLRGCIERRDSHIHKWSHLELLEIERTERWTMGVAALAGAVSGGILGAVEIWLFSGLMEDVATTHWRQMLPYWSIYLSIAVLATAAELLYLYWTLLRMVARISSIAGLCLSGEEIEQVIAIGLSRAALDLPNPRAPVYGIDPYARVPRWQQVAYAILYRVKVGLTSFILRVLLRRVLSRASLRFVIPLIAIPVFALWNAVVVRWIMREVRIRAAGPVAVQDLGDRISSAQAALSEKSRRLILETVGESIIRSQDAHPNYVILLTHLFEVLEISPDSLIIDWESSRASLGNIKRPEQDLLLITLIVATILNGRLRSAQKEFLDEVHRACGRSFQTEVLRPLRREFISGRGISDERLGAFDSVSAE